MAMIGSARIDERGQVTGGVPGDQTGKEVSTQTFYTHRNGWDLFRAKKIEHAQALASAMRDACANECIGYSQGQRSDIFKKLEKYGSLKDIKEPTSCDCSSLVRACVIQACGIDPLNFSTQSEKQKLKDTGAFNLISTVNEAYLYEGDILVTKTKGHTAIVTQGLTYPQYTPTAKVTAYSLNVRKAPDLNSKVIAWLHRGDIVNIFEQVGTWGRISPAGDLWISTKYLEWL